MKKAESNLSALTGKGLFSFFLGFAVFAGLFNDFDGNFGFFVIVGFVRRGVAFAFVAPAFAFVAPTFAFVAPAFAFVALAFAFAALAFAFAAPAFAFVAGGFDVRVSQLFNAVQNVGHCHEIDDAAFNDFVVFDFVQQRFQRQNVFVAKIVQFVNHRQQGFAAVDFHAVETGFPSGFHFLVFFLFSHGVLR